MKLIDSRTKQIALLASAWLTRNRRPILVGASAAGITGLLLAILTWLPPQMAPNLDSERERFEVVNAARRTLSQIVGGLAVLVVGGTTAWLALRRVNALEDQVHLSVQGQVTERFSRAIDQLGSTTDDGQLRLEVRMGGIRSLERVAQESADDREPILDILIAQLTEHSPYEAEDPRSDAPDIAVRMDVAAAVSAIGVLWPGRPEAKSMRLANTAIPRAPLRDASMMASVLVGTNLDSAQLHRAEPVGANLRGASLRDARLYGAQLNFAELHGADFRGARFDRNTIWAGATYDSETLWPDGFTPPGAMILVVGD